MHCNVKDITGKTFGELLVIGPAPRPEGKKGRGAYWECMCTCFKEVVVRSDSLVQGKSTSCGCTNESTTRMRNAIGPRRTKSTGCVQPSQACTKPRIEILLDMSAMKATSSDIPKMSYANENDKPMNQTQSNQQQTSVSMPLGELVALRNDLRNLSSTSRGTRMALNWLDDKIDGAQIAPLPRAIEPHRATVAAEKWLSERPRTVTGETMSEQSKRFVGSPTFAVGGAGGGAGFASPSVGGMCVGGGGGGLQFKPVLNNLSERKHSHYFKKCPYDAVDVYRVLALFGVTDQALGHAIKKLLVAGGRGAGKDIKQDIQEAIDTLERWQEMREEDVTGSLAILDLMKA